MHLIRVSASAWIASPHWHTSMLCSSSSTSWVISLNLPVWPSSLTTMPKVFQPGLSDERNRPTLCVYRQIADRSSVICTSRQGASVQISVVRWPEHEHPLAVAVDQPGTIVKSSRSYILLVSMHLYAHAAAGPEYEYPACLQCISAMVVGIPFRVDERSDDGSAALNRKIAYAIIGIEWRRRRQLDGFEPGVELSVELGG